LGFFTLKFSQPKKASKNEPGCAVENLRRTSLSTKE